jgi:hypothetical protein
VNLIGQSRVKKGPGAIAADAAAGRDIVFDKMALDILGTSALSIFHIKWQESHYRGQTSLGVTIGDNGEENDLSYQTRCGNKKVILGSIHYPDILTNLNRVRISILPSRLRSPRGRLDFRRQASWLLKNYRSCRIVILSEAKNLVVSIDSRCFTPSLRSG